MSILTDPGFELGTGWGYVNAAERVEWTPDAHSGDWYAWIGWGTGYVGAGYIEETGLKLVAGHRHRLLLWCMSDGASHGALRVRVDIGDGVYVTEAERSGDVDEYTLWDCGAFTALGTTGRLQLRCTNTTVNGHGWLVDDVLLIDTEANVAVKLSERAVDAIVALLKDQLGTELVAIDAERADGVTMAVPAAANYYKGPKAEVAGAAVHVEVFEDGFEFGNPYADAGAQRATYQVPLIVRVTYRNTAGESNDTMLKRMRRYLTGVFNVVNKNYTLADSDDATKTAVVTSVSPHWELSGEDQSAIIKAQAVVRILVRCEETQA